MATTRFELEHTAVVPEEMWSEYGPGAVGVGWDGGVLGLALHLATGKTVDDPIAWQLSDEGREWTRRSSEAWGRGERSLGRRSCCGRARGREHDQLLRPSPGRDVVASARPGPAPASSIYDARMAPTDKAVDTFLSGIKSPGQDAVTRRTMLELIGRVTGEPPQVQGRAVGYGTYHYRYPSGREGQTSAAAFAARTRRPSST